MKIVVDMNLSTDWACALQEARFDAVHWSDVGAEDAPDEEIVAWAQTNNAVILTRDLDFGAIVTLLGLDSPSIVQLWIKQARHDLHADRVKRVLSLQYERLARGAIVTIETDRVRVRRLETDDQR